MNARARAGLRWSGAPTAWVALAALALILVGGEVTPRAFAAGMLALGALALVGLPRRWAAGAALTGAAVYAATVLTWAAVEADLVDDGLGPVLVVLIALAGLAAWAELGPNTGAGVARSRFLDETGAVAAGWGRAWLEEAIERACRSGEALAVLVARVEGDAGLGPAVRAVSGRLRAVDRVVRYGPANLALIVPGVDTERADALARELRLGAAADGGVGLRFGVATFPRVGGGAEALLAEAEQALTFARLWELGVASAALLDAEAAPQVAPEGEPVQETPPV